MSLVASSVDYRPAALRGAAGEFGGGTHPYPLMKVLLGTFSGIVCIPPRFPNLYRKGQSCDIHKIGGWPSFGRTIPLWRFGQAREFERPGAACRTQTRRLPGRSRFAGPTRRPDTEIGTRKPCYINRAERKMAHEIRCAATKAGERQKQVPRCEPHRDDRFGEERAGCSIPEQWAAAGHIPARSPRGSRALATGTATPFTAAYFARGTCVRLNRKAGPENFGGMPAFGLIVAPPFEVRRGAE